MGFEFIRQIDAGEVQRLVRTYRHAVCLYDNDKERIGSKLDGIADGIRFGDMMLTGDTGADRDEALANLAGFGTDSYTGFMHGDDPIASQASCRQPGDYGSGLLRLGIPPQQVFRISASLQSGKLPSTLLNAVIYGQPRIRGLHPDKYPWPPEVFDDISGGLAEAESVHAGGVWRDAKAFLEARGRPELAQLYEGAGTPSDALAVLFENYALSSFHDANRLNREGREVHF